MRDSSPTRLVCAALLALLTLAAGCGGDAEEATREFNTLCDADSECKSGQCLPIGSDGKQYCSARCEPGEGSCPFGARCLPALGADAPDFVSGDGACIMNDRGEGVGGACASHRDCQTGLVCQLLEDFGDGRAPTEATGGLPGTCVTACDVGGDSCGAEQTCVALSESQAEGTVGGCFEQLPVGELCNGFGQLVGCGPDLTCVCGNGPACEAEEFRCHQQCDPGDPFSPLTESKLKCPNGSICHNTDDNPICALVGNASVGASCGLESCIAGALCLTSDEEFACELVCADGVLDCPNGMTCSGTLQGERFGVCR